MKSGDARSHRHSSAGNYAANTTYGTISDPIPVRAVSERGCEVRLRRSIALARK